MLKTAQLERDETMDEAEERKQLEAELAELNQEIK